jgi:transposase-like protein
VRASRRAADEVRIVERPALAAGSVSAGNVLVELPVSLAAAVEGLTAEIEQLAGQAGMLIMRAVMDAEVEQLAGPRGRHEPQRSASRWGQQAGYAVLGGKKVRLARPRVRDEAGREVGLRTYARFQSPPRRQGSIYQKLIHGISTRKYERAIEDFTEGYAISKSAVSREWVTATRGSLKNLCERNLAEFGRIAVLMIDGLVYAGECLVVALGVDEQGKKHVLGVVQGASENATVVQGLLDDLIQRGLDARARRLYVLDGAKALRSAVKKTFGDESPVQRCQIHKRRNVKEYLPPEYQRAVDGRLKAAYSMRRYADAKKMLLATVEWLEEINPSAAASLREGLEETLTLHRLNVPEALRRSLRSTNLIESALSVVRTTTLRVKRWRQGDMRLRWSAAALLAAETRFRRVRGYKSMEVLLASVNAFNAKLAGKCEAA